MICWWQKTPCGHGTLQKWPHVLLELYLFLIKRWCLIPLAFNPGRLATRLEPAKCSRSDFVWFPRLGQTRQYSFCLVSWDACLWSLEMKCRKSNYLETAMPWGSPHHGERPCICVLADIPANSQHQLPGMSGWAFRCFQTLAIKLPRPSSLPSWGPIHHGTETSHPHCVLSKFMTHRVHECYKMVVA